MAVPSPALPVLPAGPLLVLPQPLLEPDLSYSPGHSASSHSLTLMAHFQPVHRSVCGASPNITKGGFGLRIGAPGRLVAVPGVRHLDLAGDLSSGMSV